MKRIVCIRYWVEFRDSGEEGKIFFFWIYSLAGGFRF